MGNRALNWAWSLNLPITQKFVLVALADQASDTTDSCYPGQERLAEMVGGSQKTVERAVQALEEQGLLTREQRRTSRGWRTSDLYRLNVGASLPEPLADFPSTRQNAYQADGLPDDLPTRQPDQAYPTFCPPLPDSLSGQEELRSSEPLVNPKGEPLDLLTDEQTPLPEPPRPPRRDRNDARFAAWWGFYPRKVGRRDARKAFDSALRAIGGDPDTATQALIDITSEHHRHWRDLAGRSVDRMPYPATWLRAESWTDELPDDAEYRARGPSTVTETPTERLTRMRGDTLNDPGRSTNGDDRRLSRLAHISGVA